MLTRHEWRWAITGSLVVAALTCVPYIYAYLAAPSGYTFGGFISNVQDGNSYLAKMREGYDGAWLYRLAFTPEDQRGVFTFTFYLALGHLARLTSLPLIFIFHLARFICGSFLLITIYLLTSLLTTSLNARRWSFAIASFASGLAILSLLAGRNDPKNFVPLDLFVPEANGFYSIFSNPHFALVFALQAWAIILTFGDPQFKFWIQLMVIAVVGFSIVSLAPYLAPVVGVAVSAGIILTRSFTRDVIIRAVTLFASMGALLLYYIVALQSDSIIGEWSRQNITLTPPLGDVLLGLGIWLPLALIGINYIHRTRLMWSLVAWLILIAALIYFPYALQRRFLGGIFIPLSIFAGIGVAWIMRQIDHLRFARLSFLAGVILFGFTTNVLLFVSFLRAPSTPELYLKNDEVAALRWLDSKVTSTDVVLADSRLGNIIPGWTSARVVYGHPMESVDAINRKAEVDSYFSKNDLRVLDRYPIKYILGGALPPGWRIAFESGDVKIYAR